MPAALSAMLASGDASQAAKPPTRSEAGKPVYRQYGYGGVLTKPYTLTVRRAVWQGVLHEEGIGKVFIYTAAKRPRPHRPSGGHLVQ
jgi:hypothetical protein